MAGLLAVASLREAHALDSRQAITQYGHTIWTTRNGLPQGMMFGAAAGREATLIELAYELEEARPWPRIQG